MNHFLHDRHVAFALHDLQIAVVTDRQHRRTFIAPDDAALGKTAILRPVEFMAFVERGACGLALLRFRQQRRNAAVRSDDQRSADRRRDLATGSFSRPNCAMS